MENEVWKDIIGYEKLYQVSNLGRIKSLRSGKILKTFQNNNGYLCITLCENYKLKTCQIHRLVAEAFLKKNDFKYHETENKKNININKLLVNHKDENKINSKAENLEWCTYKYNSNYGTSLQRANKKKIKPVLQYDQNGNFIREWQTMTDAKKYFNCKNNEITNCCKNRRKTYKNYIWKYKN